MKSHKEIHDEIMKEYFPHTKKCPLDSNEDCIKDKCKYWIDHDSCWYTEFDVLLMEVFQTEDYDFIHFHRDDDKKTWTGHFDFCVYSRLARYCDDKKTDLAVPPKLEIEIWLNSERLALLIQKKFNLTNWEIEPKCEDGGDDHSLILKTSASPLERDHVVELLKNVKNLAPKILEYEMEANTCQFCGEKAPYLLDYGNWSICCRCRKSILVFFVNNPVCRFLFRFIKKVEITCRDLHGRG